MKCPLCLHADLTGMQNICYACAAPSRKECARIIKAGRSKACNRSEHRQDDSICRLCVSQFGQQRNCTAPCAKCHACGGALHEVQLVA